jgi:hypothetical protein
MGYIKKLTVVRIWFVLKIDIKTGGGMSIKLKPSSMWFEYVQVLWDILMKREGKGLCTLFWVASPLLPILVLGWYLGDILCQNTLE